METPGTDWATSAVMVPAARHCLVHKKISGLNREHAAPTRKCARAGNVCARAHISAWKSSGRDARRSHDAPAAHPECNSAYKLICHRWTLIAVHELENDASTRAHLLACAHACETLCCGFLARKPEVSSLVWPARRASARLRTPLRGTNFESAPSPALFNESMTTCTTLVHSTLGTYMHASSTQCIDPSGPRSKEAKEPAPSRPPRAF